MNRLITIAAIMVFAFGSTACTGEESAAELGASCQETSDCDEGLACVFGVCIDVPPSSEIDFNATDTFPYRTIDAGKPEGGEGGAAAQGGEGGTGGDGGEGGGAGEAGEGGAAGQGGEAGTGGDGGSGGDGGTGGDSGTGGSGGNGGSGGTGMTYGIDGQSCQDAGYECSDDGLLTSCCDARGVPEGSFRMGRCIMGPGAEECEDYFELGLAQEVPDHPASVRDFGLDTFEVTVGRFRNFVEAYDGTPPSVGDGAHPEIDDSGWREEWDSRLPQTQAELIQDLACTQSPEYATWTDEPEGNEQYPINCVSWFEAFAFCIWDGGRLPTEVEWEYAAAGGDENRLYPWGSSDPEVNNDLANFDGSAATPLYDVGTYPAGVARWGQHDMAGSMLEWTLDWFDQLWYLTDGNSCDNCANLSDTGVHVLRGGCFVSPSDNLRAAYRVPEPDSPVPVANPTVGIRCAR